MAINKKICIIAGGFRKELSEIMIEGVNKIAAQENWDVKVFWVNGAWEMPLMYKEVLESKKFDGTIFIGQIIGGKTTTYAQSMSHIVRDKIIGLSVEYMSKATYGIAEGESFDELHKQQTNPNRTNEGEYAAIALKGLFEIKL